jgi:predicted kinase
MNKLYVICDIPFSGKSTLAKAIVNKHGYKRVDLDDIKFEMFGNNILDENLQQKDWDAIYKRMYQIIEGFLKQGGTVVHDTGNFTKHERGLIRQIAEKLGIPSTTIFVDTPKTIAYERLLQNRQSKTRFGVSDQDFESTVAEMEPPTEEENTISFKENDDIDSWIGKHLI